ncbi:hypothetical protein [Streptomyces microflavus]|uniref:hypothetical protein n=1 Tax=Streptomyces microflavus TaxID=1919 RepID=UPI00368A9865
MTQTLTRSAADDDKEDIFMSQLRTRESLAGSPLRQDTPVGLPLTRETRQANRQETRRRLAKAPGAFVSAGAVTCSLAMTVSLMAAWGVKEAALFQIGTMLTAVYVAVNDIRRSVVGGEAWRSRHVIISWLVRRHPLD